MSHYACLVLLVSLALHHWAHCTGQLRVKQLFPEKVDPNSFKPLESFPGVSTMLDCSIKCMAKGDACSGVRLLEDNTACEIGYVEDNPSDGLLSIYSTKKVDRSATTVASTSTASPTSSSVATSTSTSTFTTSSTTTASSTATTATSTSTTGTTTSTGSTTTVSISAACYTKVALPTGKTAVTRAEAKTACAGVSGWLPELQARTEYNYALNAAKFGAQANRVDFWVGLTNPNAVITSCSGNACVGEGWSWEKSKVALAPNHLTFYDNELMNATTHQSPCIKNYFYPPGSNSYHSLFAVPCTDQLTVIICQIC